MRTSPKAKFRERRIIFVSWVPDEDRFAHTVVSKLSQKLRPIRYDDFDVPLNTRTSDELEVPGEPRSLDSVDLEQLEDITDFVAILSSPYLLANRECVDPPSAPT